MYRYKLLAPVVFFFSHMHSMDITVPAGNIRRPPELKFIVAIHNHRIQNGETFVQLITADSLEGPLACRNTLCVWGPVCAGYNMRELPSPLSIRFAVSHDQFCVQFGTFSHYFYKEQIPYLRNILIIEDDGTVRFENAEKPIG